MVLGGPLDAVFPLGLSCRPGSAADGPVTPVRLASVLLGNAFPHDHRDAEAARRALAGATVCAGTLWADSAPVLVLGVERRIGAITVLFALEPARAIPSDTVRRRVRRAWGRGVGTPQLEEWGTGRFRAYLLDTDGWDRLQRRLTMVDARACTAFDRLLHQAGEPGRAEAC